MLIYYYFTMSNHEQKIYNVCHNSVVQGQTLIGRTENILANTRMLSVFTRAFCFTNTRIFFVEMCLGTVDIKFPEKGGFDFTHINGLAIGRDGDVMWGKEALKPSQQNTALQQCRETAYQETGSGTTCDFTRTLGLHRTLMLQIQQCMLLTDYKE